jgi:hypothetical protein
VTHRRARSPTGGPGVPYRSVGSACRRRDCRCWSLTRSTHARTWRPWTSTSPCVLIHAASWRWFRVGGSFIRSRSHQGRALSKHAFALIAHRAVGPSVRVDVDPVVLERRVLCYSGGSCSSSVSTSSWSEVESARNRRSPSVRASGCTCR